MECIKQYLSIKYNNMDTVTIANSIGFKLKFALFVVCTACVFCAYVGTYV
jgi:hypothetical protein